MLPVGGRTTILPESYLLSLCMQQDALGNRNLTLPTIDYSINLRMYIISFIKIYAYNISWKLPFISQTKCITLGNY